MQLYPCPRSVLDFDFEKLCSISLSHINVYACLVCGKYFQGEPPRSCRSGCCLGDTQGLPGDQGAVKGDMGTPRGQDAAGKGMGDAQGLGYCWGGDTGDTQGPGCCEAGYMKDTQGLGRCWGDTPRGQGAGGGGGTGQRGHPQTGGSHRGHPGVGVLPRGGHGDTQGPGYCLGGARGCLGGQKQSPDACGEWILFHLHLLLVFHSLSLLSGDLRLPLTSPSPPQALP